MAITAGPAAYMHASWAENHAVVGLIIAIVFGLFLLLTLIGTIKMFGNDTVVGVLMVVLTLLLGRIGCVVIINVMANLFGTPKGL